MKQDELDAWCRAVPGLEKDEDGRWCASGIGRMSFPEDGLETLADIEPRSYWFNHRNRVIASVVRRFPPPGPIFDVGGGNGYVSLGLAKAGFDMVVVEPDGKGADVARSRGLPTIQAAFENLEIPTGTIAAVGLFDVLEHIEDEVGTLKRLYDVLQTGGVAYIAVPAFSWLWSHSDIHAGHFRRYTRTRLDKALKRAEFTPLYSTYFFKALVPPVFVFRALPSLVGRGQEDSGETLRQHTLPDTRLGRMFARSLDEESTRIERGRAMPFGTSVLVAARKEIS